MALVDGGQIIKRDWRARLIEASIRNKYYQIELSVIPFYITRDRFSDALILVLMIKLSFQLCGGCKASAQTRLVCLDIRALFAATTGQRRARLGVNALSKAMIRKVNSPDLFPRTVADPGEIQIGLSVTSISNTRERQRVGAPL
ncbi:hypothetical protein GcC1_023020 [Golovinomyces cichoracearum]|uniref:Uncharacterized protein n=1 Tax=Golovinomyces cichoracearum TaxID=62708 RepID=A0A420J4G9_9PEZI|nr:hypothetical protein GcC1_023020 [Golovinomyces cichoracearum]